VTRAVISERGGLSGRRIPDTSPGWLPMPDGLPAYDDLMAECERCGGETPRTGHLDDVDRELCVRCRHRLGREEVADDA